MTKTDLRIIKTKKNLYEGLLSIMREKTFEEIKVSDICQVSLVNRSTFYDHFTDKYELFDSLIKDLENELTQKLKSNQFCENSKEYYMNMIKLFFDHVSEHISTYSAILIKNSNSIIMDMVYNTIINDVKNHISNNTNDIPADIVSKFYVSAVTRVCLDHIRNPEIYRKDDIIKYLDQLIPENV